MLLRHFPAWLSGVALLGTGATLLWAQAPQPPRAAPARADRAKLRAEVVRLRTEVEMLRFDYELAREKLLEELKLRRGLKMTGGMLALGSSIQNALNNAGSNPPGAAAGQATQPDQKKDAEAVKAAELEEKKDAAEEAAFIAERKKDLTRQFGSLSERRLDLEDAERAYREAPR
jgi:hypothetical protein